jgi:hypothetical protein
VGVVVAGRTETTDLDQEREHAVRAALVAIEATADRLSTRRALLTAQQLDELTRSLADDVRRVRLLLDARSTAASPFDVRLPSCESR